MGANDFLIHFNARSQSNLKPTATSPEQGLKMACREFESLFVQQLLTAMRKTVPKSDLFGDRREEEMYVSLFDQELAVKLSQQKGLGLADLLYDQLKVGLSQEKGEEDTSKPGDSGSSGTESGK